MISCLILGAKGFIGSAITAEAIARGYQVFPVDLDNYRHHLGIKTDWLVNADGNSRKYLADQRPLEDFDLSVRSVACSLHDFHFRHYLHLSTVDVYPDKANPARNAENEPIDPLRLSRYGHHKWLAEELVRFNARSWMILRLGGFVGPGLKKNAIYDLLRGRPLRVHPDSAYQYHHSADVARIALNLVAADSWGEIFNLAGDGVITMREVAEMIPGCRLPSVPPQPVPERYEVNLEKIKTRCPIAPTRETVARFVRAVLEGKEALA